MSTSMRAKMVVSNVTQYKTPEGKVGSEVLEFRAVCKSDGYGPDGKDENNSFATWTPSANLAMTVNNPDLVDKMKIGDTFYVDFTPVLVVQRTPQ